MAHNRRSIKLIITRRPVPIGAAFESRPRYKLGVKELVQKFMKHALVSNSLAEK